MSLLSRLFGSSISLKRLAPVFTALEAQNILARVYPELDNAEAATQARAECVVAVNDGRIVDGFCVFGGEGIWDDSLHLTFDSVGPVSSLVQDRSRAIRIGARIVKTLTEFELPVSWRGEVTEMISIELPWSGPREKSGFTGIRLPIPEKLEIPPSWSLDASRTAFFVDGPLQSQLSARFVSRLKDHFGAEFLQSPLFGVASFTIEGRPIDVVCGKTDVEFMGHYLLKSKRTAYDCRFLVDVVPTADAEPNHFWNNFAPLGRLRVVLDGPSPLNHPDERTVSMGEGLDAVMRAMLELSTAPS